MYYAIKCHVNLFIYVIRNLVQIAIEKKRRKIVFARIEHRFNKLIKNILPLHGSTYICVSIGSTQLANCPDVSDDSSRFIVLTS